MLGEKWIVYWSEYASDTYLYGSKITFHKKDDVEFQNLLMPPGTIIKQWYSKTNFQMQKIEPTLPIIDGETEYQITLNIVTNENETCLGRLVYYDRYGVEAGSLTLRDKETLFRCPLKTYSYRLQLINGGVTNFHFHSVIIQEVLHGTEENNKKFKKRIKKSKKQ
ncbi:MAG: accessory Sec system protein Asp3 [Lachnospiraceae bacterium]|nr:accessory Sec system protein Asp3 [Lachnospiraceae bacterium]